MVPFGNREFLQNSEVVERAYRAWFPQDWMETQKKFRQLVKPSSILMSGPLMSGFSAAAFDDHTESCESPSPHTLTWVRGVLSYAVKYWVNEADLLQFIGPVQLAEFQDEYETWRTSRRDQELCRNFERNPPAVELARRRLQYALGIGHLPSYQRRIDGHFERLNPAFWRGASGIMGFYPWPSPIQIITPEGTSEGWVQFLEADVEKFLANELPAQSEIPFSIDQDQTASLLSIPAPEQQPATSLISVHIATSDSNVEPAPAPSGGTTLREPSSFVAFMLETTAALGLVGGRLPNGERMEPHKIRDWLGANWWPELGALSGAKLEMMTTFIRHPDDGKGGLYPRRNGGAHNESSEVKASVQSKG